MSTIAGQVSLAWFLGMSLFLAGQSSHAQYVGGPLDDWQHPVSTSLQTTGGITYFTLTATLNSCNWIESGPVTRSGTNLSFHAAQMSDGGWCVECINCINSSRNAVVLGNLPGGTYRLSIYTPRPSDPWHTTLWRVMDISVPVTDDAPMVVSREGDKLRIAVAGVPVAKYVIESSTTLSNWTGCFTNTGAPFTFTTTISNAPVQFYRLSVASGSQ